MENQIPKTTREAFRILDAMLSEEKKAEILAQTKLDFTANAHFGLGMWIRNNWIYLDKEGVGLFANKYNKDPFFGMVFPDTISEEFLGKYYDHLRRTRKC